MLQRTLKSALCQILCIAICFSTGCDRNGGNTDLDKRGDGKDRLLRRGIPGEPRTLDPQLADDFFSNEVVLDLFEGLTTLDQNGNVKPGVASSWKTDPSGTVYTFSLRQEAKWSDGEPITPDEFVAGLRRAVDPKTGSGSAGLLATIKNANAILRGEKPVTELGVSAPDKNSVRVELERPAPYVLQILGEPIATPLHRPTGPSEPSGSVVTDGPYILAGRVPNSFIDLTRNPRYWDAQHVAITRIRYVNASEATELHQYEAGELDLTYGVPTPEIPRVSKELGGQLHVAPILGTLYLALNMTRAPLRGNRDLRQALSMAIDRELIAEHLVPGVTPAYAFVARGIHNYDPPVYSWAAWSSDRRLSYARSLYEHAGYSASHPLHLTLYFNSGESNQRVMLAVAGAWKEHLGVETTLQNDEFRVFLSGRRDHSRWDAVRLGWGADYNDPSSFLENFSNTSNQNDPNYESSEFNGLLDSARLDSNESERLKTLNESERVLLNDYPIIPIYFYTAARLVKPYVGGVQISPLRRTYSKYLFWSTFN